MLHGLFLAAAAPKPVPGVVIDYHPASSKAYIGSPSLAILPNGDYVASHDEFGPGKKESGVTLFFKSTDRGLTWTPSGKVKVANWSTLFVHKGALYLMGNSNVYGQFVIRRSDDEGASWTYASVLREEKGYHSAPTPVVFAGGRVWRALEQRPEGGDWAKSFCAGVISAPQDSDLLNPRNWTMTNLLPSDRSWNGGDMYGWLEGGAVARPDGSVVDMLRVDVRKPQEKAALIKISADGTTATFDPQTGFVDFPGGSKKFTIRYDPTSRLYWSLTSSIADDFQNVPPSHVRNTLSLTSSPDLVHWTIRRTILSSTGVHHTGFQYADWQFDGNDIAAVVRTAFNGANSAHNSNYLTFNRVVNFRDDEPVKRRSKREARMFTDR